MLQIRGERGNRIESGVYLSRYFDARRTAARLGQTQLVSRLATYIARRDGYLEHVDRGGEGDNYAYRIVPLPWARPAGHISPRPREPSPRIPRYR